MKKYAYQVNYCLGMMERLHERVRSRHTKMMHAGRGCYDAGVEQLETKENICRMIRQLRAELLELEGMVKNDK